MWRMLEKRPLTRLGMMSKETRQQTDYVREPQREGGGKGREKIFPIAVP